MHARWLEAESEIRKTWEIADFSGATTLALRSYGPEVLGFLIALDKDHDAAEQAFSHFAERLWRGMQRFEWKCSVRTWSYVLARHAAADVRRGEAKHRRHRVPFSDDPISEVAARVRTATISLLRTDSRTAFARLRDELPEDARALLVLRVDRELEWREIARVFGAEESTIDRETARLRKRFQLVKERLKTLGKARGLI
ncbi:MAG TPA: sigma-70 family RNA polymerase sigma factor [Polyangiaceae bacterium]